MKQGKINFLPVNSYFSNWYYLRGEVQLEFKELFTPHYRDFLTKYPNTTSQEYRTYDVRVQCLAPTLFIINKSESDYLSLQLQSIHTTIIKSHSWIIIAIQLNTSTLVPTSHSTTKNLSPKQFTSVKITFNQYY